MKISARRAPSSKESIRLYVASHASRARPRARCGRTRPWSRRRRDVRVAISSRRTPAVDPIAGRGSTPPCAPWRNAIPDRSSRVAGPTTPSPPPSRTNRTIPRRRPSASRPPAPFLAPANPRSPDAARPPSAIRTAAPVPRRRLRRSVVHGDRRPAAAAPRRRRAKTRRHLRRGRRRPARRRGSPTARLSNLERTRRVRAWGSNGRRRGGRAQDVDSRPTADAPTGETKPACRGSSPSTASSPRPSSRRDDGGARGGAGGWRSRVKRR